LGTKLELQLPLDAWMDGDLSSGNLTALAGTID
jgi:hypothetical protein